MQTASKRHKINTPNGLLAATARIFDRLAHFWEREETERSIASLLCLAFLVSLAVIEMRRLGLLPAALSEIVPTSHFAAINGVFTLLLVAEVMSLIFALARSVSISFGKQVEILSLILLRQSFKELGAVGYPIDLAQHLEPLLHILSDGAGALIIFVGLGFFYRLQRHRCTIRTTSIGNFIAIKKLVALALFIVFVGAATENTVHYLSVGGHDDGTHSFFLRFYTILIFSDILIMLVTLRYQPGFHALFRNSGFALSTLLIRLSLAAPAYWNVGLGLSAVLLALALTAAYNIFTPEAQSLCDEEIRSPAA